MKQTFCHRHRRRRRSGRGYPGRHLRENLQSPRLAPGAQRNQVGLFIRALLTAQLFVMDLQILLRATDLTPPVVPLHHPLPKLLPQLESSKTLQLSV